MKPIECFAEVLLLGGAVDAHAVARRCSPTCDCGRRGDAVEPGQRLLDLVRLEADRRQLAGQLLVLGAGVGPPVVLVQVHEHIEHGFTIPQRFRADPAARGFATQPAAAAPDAPPAQPRAMRWNSCPGRRATRPSSSRSSRRALSSAARQPVRATSASSVDRIEAQGGEQRVARCRRAAARPRRAVAVPTPAAAQLLEDVGGAVDQLGALLDQRVAAARLRRMDRAGNREHVAPGLDRQPGGDQRARLQRRLDHQRAAASARR